ncbi:regulator of G-protein signaling 17-like [Podarcis raffonei]|uniref:regulator of G-protein signaling 17-like n=1 Tax=Podarcis raffonei TaxID=65483 RepID=UPI0023296547|nr:regulator of G-protein signaling 17-like [Podarcis raffonei]
MESSSPAKGRQLSETTRRGLCRCCRRRHCCFCWCCCNCCTWNRLARKRRRDGVGCKVSSISNLESPLNLEERLTAEEAASWQWSFDSMLTSPAGRRIFMEFLQTEHSEENMSFWLACEDLKREQSPEQISEKAKKIYLDYISILSPKEVSIDAAVRETINNSLPSPGAHMFDEAQAQVYALMHRDSYPRFLKSPLYKSLEQRLTMPVADT